MRFEIRTGGLIGILVGLALLSGAVFVLGLLAGYDVGRQSEVDGAQIATAYPLPPPPNAMPSPAAASPPAASTSPTGLSENNPTAPNTPSSPNSPASGYAPAKTANTAGGIGESSIPSSPPHPHASTAQASARQRPVPSPVATPRQVEANAKPAPPAPKPAATPARTVEAANPPPAPKPRRKPYNIQIEAAMDRVGADAMVARLEQLGYQPHLVPTRIDGETWFKVEIGPYATEEEAETAQDELRVRYNRAFGVGAARNPAH